MQNWQKPEQPIRFLWLSLINSMFIVLVAATNFYELNLHAIFFLSNIIYTVFISSCPG
ncbi:hypothetical protein M2354_004570 [Leclercia adecarboxylata]|nr:hypothetical protein [Leclercia adecarboxylata]